MTPEFFVPAAEDDAQAEQVYQDLAAQFGQPVEPPGRRIYSIKFVNDGEEWTATVGEEIRGVRRMVGKRRAERVERTTRLVDPATVLVILPGDQTYVVLTNARPLTTIVSKFVNPFFAGRPLEVVPFSRGAGAS